MSGKNGFTEKLLVEAHLSCSHNVLQAAPGQSAACFYCLECYPATEVEEWWDDGTTAVCPRCGIDSVLFEQSGLPLQDAVFLAAMHARWF
jgi:hypothetical protein